MALKMSKNSLFAILLRSPWWYSVGVGLAIVLVSMTLVGGNYGILFTSLSFPFFGIAGYAAYLQRQKPNQKRILEIATQARQMSSAEIADKIALNYTNVRFDSETFNGKGADLLLTRGNRILLLCSKRFKAANTGIEPLKQLVAAGEKAEATGYLYVALGEFSSNARQYAKDNDIELIQAEGLTLYFDGLVKI